jgi:hypothetical protein
MSDDLVKRPVLRIYTEATSDKGGIWAFQPYAVAHTVFVEESNYRDLEDRIEAAEKELQEMQAHIDHADAYHKAMLAAEADNARLQGMVDKCQSIAKDAVSMCNEGIPVSAKNVAMAVLRALTGNVTVGGGRVDWGDQPVSAPTGKADT